MLSLALLLLLRVLRMRFSATDVFQSAVVVIPARAPREPSLPRGASPTRLPGLTLRTDLQPLFLFLLGKKRCPRTLSYLSHPRSGVSRFSEELRRVSGRSACEARGTRSGYRGSLLPDHPRVPGPIRGGRKRVCEQETHQESMLTFPIRI